MNAWLLNIKKIIPDFDLGRCRFLLRLDLWEGVHGRCCRLVLDYAGRFDIALIVTGISELPMIRPSATPGALPYVPYDLGEFMISEQPWLERVVLFDELNGWKIVGESVLLEGISNHVGHSA